MSNQHPKSNGGLWPNDKKTQQNHPDHRGFIELTKAQLDRLYQMGQQGMQVKLQLAAWHRQSQQGGAPYVSLEAEAYMPQQQQQGGFQQPQQQGFGGQPQGGFGQPAPQRPPPQQQTPPQQSPAGGWGTPEPQDGNDGGGFTDDDVPF